MPRPQLATFSTHGRNAGQRKVIHVSEAFGGGLASSLLEYVRATPEYKHILVFAPRLEAPVSEKDLSYFERVHKVRRNPVLFFRDFARVLKRERASVVHAHSAFAGVYARLLAPGSPRRVVYTPHCYAHLREDFARPVRLAFWVIEAFLSFLTSEYVACSRYEAAVSERWPASRHATYAPNICTADTARNEDAVIAARSIRLLAVGRINAQKDPEFYLRSVLALREEGFTVEAVWVGDGDPTMRQSLEQAGVKVLGWVDRDRARMLYAETSTVYLHCARWEGFPIGVLEAASAGVPTLVRQSLSLSMDAVPIAIENPAEVVRAIETLLTVEGYSAAMASNDSVLEEHTFHGLRKRLVEVYDRVSAQSDCAERR